MGFEIISPTTSEELRKLLESNQDKNIRLGAGFTDLMIEIKKKNLNDLTVINLAKIKEKEFTTIQVTVNEVRIGSLVTIAEITKNKYLQENFPVLVEAANGLASMQIREVATVGGNICQASPSGDVSCAIYSLNATCEILNSSGQLRKEPMVDFFKGPGKTSLTKNEVLQSVIFPVSKSSKLRSGFIKIGKRVSMECSIVSLAYQIHLAENGTIEAAGIACGAVGPTFILCQDAISFIKGKNIETLSTEDKEQFAQKVQQLATPIDDVRSTAWYRKEVLYNSAVSIFE